MYTCPQLLGQEREDGLCDPVPQRVPANTLPHSAQITSSAHRLCSLHPAFSSASLTGSGGGQGAANLGVSHDDVEVDQHQRKHRSVILGAHELPQPRRRPQHLVLCEFWQSRTIEDKLSCDQTSEAGRDALVGV